MTIYRRIHHFSVKNETQMIKCKKSIIENRTIVLKTLAEAVIATYISLIDNLFLCVEKLIDKK